IGGVERDHVVARLETQKIHTYGVAEDAARAAVVDEGRRTLEARVCDRAAAAREHFTIIARERTNGQSLRPGPVFGRDNEGRLDLKAQRIDARHAACRRVVAGAIDLRDGDIDLIVARIELALLDAVGGVRGAVRNAVEYDLADDRVRAGIRIEGDGSD